MYKGRRSMFVPGKTSRHIRQEIHHRCRYAVLILCIDLDFRKHSKALGHSWTQGVPIEIVPLAHTKVLNDLLKLGAQKPQLRMGGKAKAGPIITDNGNFIIDAHFGEIADPEGLAEKIKKLVGVVEVGLFINMANAAYFGIE